MIVLIGSLLLGSQDRLCSFAAAEAARAAPEQIQSSPNSKAGTPATVVDDREAGGVLGRNVRSTAGEDMGHIIDVIVSRTGKVRAAVIDFGGFLGVGSRKIAVAWDTLRFPSTGQLDPVTLELTRDQVRLAPEILPGEPIVVLGSPDAPQREPAPRQPK
jgi:hypothetical protein